jgi:hypothetical protein
MPVAGIGRTLVLAQQYCSAGSVSRTPCCALNMIMRCYPVCS